MDKEEIMRTAEKVKEWMYTLDNAVKYLQNAKTLNKNVYIEFNGNNLYSLLDDEDSCYLKVIGVNKKTYDEHMEKREQEEKRKIKEAHDKIPEWIEQGKKLIYPQRIEDWKICVETRVDDLYHGKELDVVLEVMECLDKNDSISEAIKTIHNADLSGVVYGIVMSVVSDFSKRGPEFYKAINGQTAFDRSEIMRQVEKENEQFKKELEEAEKEL